MFSASLDFTIKVQNRSQEIMPFSFGLHPYFNVSDLNTIQLEGLPPRCINHLNMLECDTEQELNFLERGVDFLAGPSNKISLIDPMLININSYDREIIFSKC